MRNLLKFRVITVLVLLLSSVSYAKDLAVQMSQYCRYPNGNFQAMTESASVDLVPGNPGVAQTLDKIASEAKQSNQWISFGVAGSVLDDTTVPGPGGSGTVHYIRMLVYGIRL